MGVAHGACKSKSTRLAVTFLRSPRQAGGLGTSDNSALARSQALCSEFSWRTKSHDLIYSRYCAKCSLRITSFNPCKSPRSRCYYYPIIQKGTLKLKGSACALLPSQ